MTAQQAQLVYILVAMAVVAVVAWVPYLIRFLLEADEPNRDRQEEAE